MARPKLYTLCGLGNSLMDILTDVPEEFLQEYELEKGTMRLVEAEEQQELLRPLGNIQTRTMSGGSLANSTLSFAQLGGKAAFLGSVANDEYGNLYKKEFESSGIRFPAPIWEEGRTGTCVSLITPDAERTMRTCLGVSSLLGARHIDEETIARSEWLFIEGYVFANPEHGQGAVQLACDIAKDSKTKIAVTLSEPWVIGNFREAMEKVLEHTTLVFANEEEACSLTRTQYVDEAFTQMKGMFPSCAITLGSQGAMIRHEKEEGAVPAVTTKAIDLTGAGDMFAGAFLYGIAHGHAPLKSGKAACSLASRVISQIGARLSGDLHATFVA